MMEHRYNQRLPATIDVMICGKHKLPAIHFKTSNAGAGGIFIKMAFEPYTLGSLLDILFELEVSRRHKKPRRFHFPAKVVHISTEGIGLAFLDTTNETTLAWQQILYRVWQPTPNAKMG